SYLSRYGSGFIDEAPTNRAPWWRASSINERQLSRHEGKTRIATLLCLPIVRPGEQVPIVLSSHTDYNPIPIAASTKVPVPLATFDLPVALRAVHCKGSLIVLNHRAIEAL